MQVRKQNKEKKRKRGNVSEDIVMPFLIEEWDMSEGVAPLFGR